jgi:hypothetical protein
MTGVAPTPDIEQNDFVVGRGIEFLIADVQPIYAIETTNIAEQSSMNAHPKH